MTADPVTVPSDTDLREFVDRYVFPYERGERILTPGRLLILLFYCAVILVVVFADFFRGG